MRRRTVTLALAALLATGPGCFLGELDASMDLMDEMSGGGKKAEAEAEAPDEPAARTPRTAAKDWWKSARTPASGPADGTAATDIVTCRLGGETRFMSRTDCEVQGGRF